MPTIEKPTEASAERGNEKPVFPMLYDNPGIALQRRDAIISTIMDPRNDAQRQRLLAKEVSIKDINGEGHSLTIPEYMIFLTQQAEMHGIAPGISYSGETPERAIYQFPWDPPRPVVMDYV